MIRCKCGREDCSGAIWFEETSRNAVQFFLENDITKTEYSIYLDANGLLDLIKETRKQLLELSEK